MLNAATIRRILRGRVGIGVVRPAELASESEPEVPATTAPEARASRIDSVMGRLAAKRALTDLGASVVPIPVGPDRAPAWPAEVVGSIAHTLEIAVAVVGWATDLLALGIDIESSGRRIDDMTARRICTATEASRFTARPGPGAVPIHALFCAKEATYKALAPLGATRLGFHDVEYAPAGSGTLEGRIVSEAVAAHVPRSFSARYVAADGFVVATVQIERPG